MIKMQFKKTITCVDRLTKNCKDCKKDYNPNHHPNNLDCVNYKEAVVRIFKVKEK